MENLLQYEKSPYLLQHKNNPVNWYPWGSEAFEKARMEDKPVFLSIGYSTCHWCHVMAHESFEDEYAAEVINRSFVPIKVDREERPDIDAVYMEACVAMTGSGGWPLTVLMTSDQKPFWAGTYLPKKHLISLLRRVDQLWKEQRESLLAAGDELTAHLRREEEVSAGELNRKILERAAAQYGRLFDPAWGGFGRAPKFPTPHNLIFLMRYAKSAGDENAMEMAEKTLEAMYRGGIFDHIGGGFSRYSTDARWLAPHFEKMLYDNALLLFAYTEAFKYTGRELYKTVSYRIAEYVLRELEAPNGGFFCGQDADSEGVEGKYYVFTPEELSPVLGEEDAQKFCGRYDITAEGNFEGRSIPNLIGKENIDEEPQWLDEVREKLYEYRLNRTSLHKDDKILTAWNGLMIAGFARAGFIFDEPAFIEAAERAVGSIDENLTDDDGRLLARWRDGDGAIPAKLDDYAFLAWGLLELYGATFKIEYLSKARRLSKILLDFFFDREKGGLYPYASDGEQLIARSKEVYDGAMPSGNAVAALVFSRLARLTGEINWIETAQSQFSYLSGAAAEQPAGHSFAMLAFLEELWPSAELICAAKEIPGELKALLRQSSANTLNVLVKTPENKDMIGELAPFTRDHSIPERGVRYYLCQNGACMKPTEDISEIKQLFGKL